MNKEKCPCCHNHCDVDNLSCDRGREYFSRQNQSEELTIGEEVINDLRTCGHMLHHNRELDSNAFLLGLSSNELQELHKLLSKICSEVKN